MHLYLRWEAGIEAGLGGHARMGNLRLVSFARAAGSRRVGQEAQAAAVMTLCWVAPWPPPSEALGPRQRFWRQFADPLLGPGSSGREGECCKRGGGGGGGARPPAAPGWSGHGGRCTRSGSVPTQHPVVQLLKLLVDPLAHGAVAELKIEEQAIRVHLV